MVIVIIGILSTISVATFQGYFAKAQFASVQDKGVFLGHDVLVSEGEQFMARYTFDDNDDIRGSNPYLRDNSGNGNNFTGRYGVSVVQSSDTFDRIGQSVRFNGDTKYVLTNGNIDKIPVGKITIAFWFNRESSHRQTSVSFLWQNGYEY